MSKIIFTILITTKNRKEDLAFTLEKIEHLLDRADVQCIICDDGSTDTTATFVELKYPKIRLIQNTESKGLIYSRNRLLEMVTTDFAVSIDDDAHFVTESPLESIQKHFEENTNCGVVALRIFWGLQEPKEFSISELPYRVKGFVGCAHVWRMTAWRAIANFPDWFIFYGEEDFASYQLFKKNWQVHYLPEVLVSHRVDVKARKNNIDYTKRLRRSLRSGWYLFFMFYPISKIPRKMAYSIWMQLKSKVFEGDFKALKAIVLALFDLIWNIPRIIKNSNRLSNKEYQDYIDLPKTKLYWQPDNLPHK
jgi:glycosyltransferase involved in cell wall biosynthesis